MLNKAFVGLGRCDIEQCWAWAFKKLSFLSLQILVDICKQQPHAGPHQVDKQQGGHQLQEPHHQPPHPSVLDHV